jgi:hypothetical protein
MFNLLAGIWLLQVTFCDTNILKGEREMEKNAPPTKLHVYSIYFIQIKITTPFHYFHPN